jgi:hypothetical protein
MHGRACIKQAARTLHIRKSNRIHFSFLSWSEESSGCVRVKCYCRCARTTLPGQGPPEARPTPRLEASSPLPCFAFPFQHAKIESSRTPPPPSGGRHIHPNKAGQIHPNNRYVQICKNLILSASSQTLELHNDHKIEPNQIYY